MPQTLLTAGDALGPTVLTAGNDGTLALVVGPAGGKLTALSIDAAGQVTLPTNTTTKLVSASGTAPVFGIRAWGNFDGTLAGTNAPTAGGNVTSITRTAVGTSTVTMTTAMPDVNYSVVLGVPDSGYVTRVTQSTKTTTTFQLITLNSVNAAVDYVGVQFAVIR